MKKLALYLEEVAIQCRFRLLFFPLSQCRDHLEDYTKDYTTQVPAGYCMVYIFVQTFMIPGTVFMSLLAGALFGGLALAVCAAIAGASSCCFLSMTVGRPPVLSFWPGKFSFFHSQVAKRRRNLFSPCSSSGSRRRCPTRSSARPRQLSTCRSASLSRRGDHAGGLLHCQGWDCPE